MVADWLQKLLILQDRDSRCDGIRLQLDNIPYEIKAEQANIQKLDDELNQKQDALKQMEVKRLDLEGEVEQTEATILKYKTQQLQVKKNEEYTALENEIKNLQTKISELEDEELLLLEEIDQHNLTLEKEKERTEREQHTLQAHVELLKRNYAASKSELDNAIAAVRNCESDLDPQVLQQYRYVKSQVKRTPVVVPLEDNHCQGCHLKVSGEVETETRKGRELVRCDSCGRILYYDR